MENFGKLVIGLVTEAKFSVESGLMKAGILPEEEQADSRKAKDRQKVSRSLYTGLRQLARAISEDESWQEAQAKRRWEKQDIINNNPGFDPIFMKV